VPLAVPPHAPKAAVVAQQRLHVDHRQSDAIDHEGVAPDAQAAHCAGRAHRQAHRATYTARLGACPLTTSSRTPDFAATLDQVVEVRLAAIQPTKGGPTGIAEPLGWPE
jgi:hypothetical protein